MYNRTGQSDIHYRMMEVQRQAMRKKRKYMPFIYAAVVIALFGLIYLVNDSNRNELYDKPVSKLNPATRELLNDPNYQNIILPGELDKLVQSGEPAFVYFFASTCGFCRETTPILKPMAEEMNIDLPQFNLAEFQEYYRKYNIDFTPTLSYFESGEEVARIVGGIGPAGYSAEEYREFLQNPRGFNGNAS